MTTKLRIQIWLRERKYAIGTAIVMRTFRLGQFLTKWAQSQQYWVSPLENRYVEYESRYRRGE